ncbi:MAG: S80 family phage morphogenetic serine protease [bacterium]
MKDIIGDNVLILERSKENLKKVNSKNKVILEGVFAEFGRENKNGRIYEEKEYLPHLEYLKEDINKGSLLGELDHPERFEVALGNVSHRVIDLWYDQAKRQVRGKIEILEGTPKGQLAKALLDAGVPLSISSRAAGSVNEDKTVEIQQIYTYDLVAKPGFESAQLSQVTENQHPKIKDEIKTLNESIDKFNKKYHELSEDLGIVNENVSIYDITDRFPNFTIRKEAQKIKENKNRVKNKNGDFKMEKEKEKISEEALQEWTVHFNNLLSQVNKRLDNVEKKAINENSTTSSKELKKIRTYIENLRKIQEDSINWQGDIAKALNKVARYADNLAEKSNAHYDLTQKIVETVDYNAKALNKTQDWVGDNAKVTNAIAETVDHNADLLNKINEWNEEQAKAINALNEWGEDKAKAINALNEWAKEKAKAINSMHEWTSNVAKGVNATANYTEDMIGRAVNKEEAKKIMEYVDLVAQSKKNPKLKKKLQETLKKNSITGESLKESMPKGLGTITDVNSVKGTTYSVENKGIEKVELDDKSKTLVKDMKKVKFSGNKKPKELESKDSYVPKMSVGKSDGKGKDISGWLDSKQKSTSKGNEKGGPDIKKPKGVMTLDIHSNHKSRPNKASVKLGKDGPSSKFSKQQNMKLDTKSSGKSGFHTNENLNESNKIRSKSSRLDENLSKIISNAQKEKAIIDETKKEYPFTNLLGESDIRKFAGLSKTDKRKVANEVAKNPTNDSDVIKKLWENALIAQKNDEPLWLKAAPKAYKEKYKQAPRSLKESINARAEMYDLRTQYQINNFWETSGLLKTRAPKLNEAVTAKSSKKSSQQFDSFIDRIGQELERYNKK